MVDPNYNKVAVYFFRNPILSTRRSLVRLVQKLRQQLGQLGPLAYVREARRMLGLTISQNTPSVVNNESIGSRDTDNFDSHINVSLAVIARLFHTSGP